MLEFLKELKELLNKYDAELSVDDHFDVAYYSADPTVGIAVNNFYVELPEVTKAEDIKLDDIKLVDLNK